MSRLALVQGRRRLAIAAIGFVGALCVEACSNEGPLIAPRPDPFLYLVINERVVAHGVPAQGALFLTVGSPTESFYRSATQFEMRRGDGAVFIWRDLGKTGLVSPNVDLFRANYELPDTARGSSPGALDIAPGDQFDLTIQTDTTTIHGHVTVPAQVLLSIRQDGADFIVSWPHVAGAGGYSVSIPSAVPRFQTDTMIVVPSTDSGTVVVKALDANFWQYSSNQLVGRAGIDRGFGLFGALTQATLRLPLATSL